MSRHIPHLTVGQNQSAPMTLRGFGDKDVYSSQPDIVRIVQRQDGVLLVSSDKLGTAIIRTKGLRQIVARITVCGEVTPILDWEDKYVGTTGEPNPKS